MLNLILSPAITATVRGLLNATAGQEKRKKAQFIQFLAIMGDGGGDVAGAGMRGEFTPKMLPFFRPLVCFQNFKFKF